MILEEIDDNKISKIMRKAILSIAKKKNFIAENFLAICQFRNLNSSWNFLD